MGLAEQASTRPPSIEGGKGGQDQAQGWRGASTGPPSIEGGKPVIPSSSQPRQPPCFNGAALNRGRKAGHPLELTAAAAAVLQRGRPQSRAER
ncbi:Periplasmic thiol disulfide interchange protein DsbA [Enhygromyxa salina]|uniref:Periplasmic thiol disulfide interchange protein DsbA n=1 Tax=Enhygromyxa salina TaxID=215803 RepID=A0A0C1ZN76_9BACT|nr:Periplasmic thiol disulfide interchange protein DsbA [Enhygromyxa salina]